MKTIKKDELFHSLGGFLKTKGIELNEGSYSSRIQHGCNLLSDAINATQRTVKQGRGKMEQALDQLRQTIHERTAPKAPEPAKSKARPSGRTTRPGKKQNASRSR